MLGDVVVGPAVIREPLSTTHVGRGQIAAVGSVGEIVITARNRPQRRERR